MFHPFYFYFYLSSLNTFYYWWLMINLIFFFRLALMHNFFFLNSSSVFLLYETRRFVEELWAQGGCVECCGDSLYFVTWGAGAAFLGYWFVFWVGLVNGVRVWIIVLLVCCRVRRRGCSGDFEEDHWLQEGALVIEFVLNCWNISLVIIC